MENIVLTVHLLLALALILTVLLQRSEGGGLGIGGGGGGVASGRPPASPIAKFTWALAIGFIITSLTLTYYATQQASGGSVVDGLDIQEQEIPGSGGLTLPPLGGDLTPPALDGDGLTPPPLSSDALVPPGLPQDNDPSVPPSGN